MHELTFTKFVKGKKVWFLISTDKNWNDTWKCNEPKEYVVCHRKDLLNWANKGYITPI